MIVGAADLKHLSEIIGGVGIASAFVGYAAWLMFNGLWKIHLSRNLRRFFGFVGLLVYGTSAIVGMYGVMAEHEPISSLAELPFEALFIWSSFRLIKTPIKKQPKS